MTIGSTPSASEINVELGRAATATFDINGAAERGLAGVPTGPITFADFIGKSADTGYDQYLTWLTNTKTNGVIRQGSDTIGVFSQSSFEMITNVAKAGTMLGSPFGPNSKIRATSVVQRVVQHAVESEAQMNDIVANNWRCAFNSPTSGNLNNYAAINRNGYQSQASASSNTGTQNSSTVWWDGTNGRQRDNNGASFIVFTPT